MTYNASGAGSETRRVFYPATSLSPEGETASEGTAFNHLTMSNTGSFRLNFFIPPEAASAIKVFVMIVPDTTETVQYDVVGDHAALGQLITQGSDTITDGTLAVTDNTLAELDVSDAFTGVAGGDYCGIEFQSDTTNIRCIGLCVEYSS